jgi:hypothetical protein
MTKTNRGDDPADADGEARTRRRDRLAAALRQNLIKRKTQARARREPPDGTADPVPPDETDPGRAGRGQ